MIRAKVKTRKSASAAWRKAAQQSPRLMRNGALIVVRREREALRKDYSVPVRKPKHPFVWSPTKQKQLNAQRWWFVQIKLGRIQTDGKRYIRSGSILRGWKLISNFKDFDALIKLQNSAAGAKWVVGEEQVPSHARSGHPRIDKLAVRSSKRMSPQLRVLWNTVSRPKVA